MTAPAQDITIVDHGQPARRSATRSAPRSAPRVPTTVHKLRRTTLHSQLLGDITIDADAILEFPDGLFGFPACKRWVMVGTERAGWCWLHAVDHPALAFLLVDPFEAFPGYSVTLSAPDMAALGATNAAEVGVFAIVTLPRTVGESMTANLQGPVAIVASSRRGRQLVLGEGARVPLKSCAE